MGDSTFQRGKTCSGIWSWFGARYCWWHWSWCVRAFSLWLAPCQRVVFGASVLRQYPTPKNVSTLVIRPGGESVERKFTRCWLGFHLWWRVPYLLTSVLVVECECFLASDGISYLLTSFLCIDGFLFFFLNNFFLFSGFLFIDGFCDSLMVLFFVVEFYHFRWRISYLLTEFLLYWQLSVLS